MSFTSYKWISASGGKENHQELILGDEAHHAFSNLGTRSHCNIISIFGRARQGKSFMMNCLSGESEIFRVSNEKESVSIKLLLYLHYLNFLTINFAYLFLNCSVRKVLISQISG